MAQIPASIAGHPWTADGRRLDEALAERGVTRPYRGKVCDLYTHGHLPQHFIKVWTDRPSVDDFSLPFLIPDKGAILCACDHFWATQFDLGFNTDFDAKTAEYVFNLFPELPRERTTVVRKVEPRYPWELIWRFHLGGSVWKGYLKDGVVAGTQLPPGMQKWQKLPEEHFPLFTPSTKAEDGHDENVSVDEFLEQADPATIRIAKEMQEQLYRIYNYCLSRGLVLYDLKGEAGFCEARMSPVNCDERPTPDTTRLVRVAEHEAAQAEGREPEEHASKEALRIEVRKIYSPFLSDEGQALNTKGLDPSNRDHVRWVHDNLMISASTIGRVRRTYLDVVEQLIGAPLHEYQREAMGVLH